MKKITKILSLILVACLLTGCAGTPVVYYADCTCPTEGEAEQTPNTEATEAPVVAEGALKTGLAIVASATDSVDGEAKYDATIVAVLVDDDGIIRDCIIDSIGTSVKFGADGVITSDVAAEILTKNELGDNYNMKLYGGATYEWYEQAAALAKYVIGKDTVDLHNGAIDENGYAADADLATTASIYLGGYISAIEVAVATAQHLGAQAGDTLKLAVVASLADSKSAEGENAGTAQLNVDATAITMNGDVITSCVLDSVQGKVGFDAAGTITSGTDGIFATKNLLGEQYGMVAWGGAIAEWNQQAASFAAYVTGKTLAEVQGIAVTESTKPAEDTDLAASVTIAVGGFQTLIAKAAETQSAGLKTGLAIIAGAEVGTKDENHTLTYDVTLAAVVVDAEGVIVDCVIDSLGVTLAYDNTGAIVTDLTAPILTKNELGDSYGMKAYGGATYEWYEQAAALAEFAIGKTVEELRSGAVNESGKAADADLATTATIYLGGYVAAIEKAVANAQELGAQAGDELKLTSISALADSTGVTEEAPGWAKLNVDVTAITMKGEVITSCVIDSLQAEVPFYTDGTANIPQFSTKNERGEGYGMKAWGGAKYEWNEQAANFAAYVTGKTLAEVQGIAVTESTKPAEGTDLATSVTIAVGGFLALIAKACQ